MQANRKIQGHVLEVLQQVEASSVHCCVTSPPYYGLRDYGTQGVYWPAMSYVPMPGLSPIDLPEWHGSLGMEPSPEMFIGHLVAVFLEVKRVLRDDGTLWLNLGDSFNGSGKGKGDKNTTSKQATNKGTRNGSIEVTKVSALKPKDLVMIPARAAMALQADGWYLRSDIIWAKKNCMPESVKDRPTRAHEYIFLLSKGPKYYYDADAIKEERKNPADDIRRMRQQKNGNKSMPDVLKNGLRPKGEKQRGHSRRHDVFNERWDNMTKAQQQSMGANKRDVWHVATKPYKDAHFATFPPDLIEPCVLAGCPPGGVVLDTFSGSGTTGHVAVKHGRNYILIELNEAYIPLQDKRINGTQIKMGVVG